jgi:DNA-binding transcriptional LysR family regulator
VLIAYRVWSVIMFKSLHRSSLSWSWSKSSKPSKCCMSSRFAEREAVLRLFSIAQRGVDVELSLPPPTSPSHTTVTSQLLAKYRFLVRTSSHPWQSRHPHLPQSIWGKMLALSHKLCSQLSATAAPFSSKTAKSYDVTFPTFSFLTFCN